MKRLIFGFLILASLLGGCVVESDLDTDEQTLEGTDDISRPVPWPGLPGGPRIECGQASNPCTPMPPPKPNYIPIPPPWPDPRIQCDDGPHCCPDPRGCPPTLPK